MRSPALRFTASLFIGFYLFYTLQASLQHGMKTKGWRVWPWNPWNMFQHSGKNNLRLIAKGKTSSGKEVEIDLDQMFRYSRGHVPHGRYTGFGKLHASLNRHTAFKNRFCDFVRAHFEGENLEQLDLWVEVWPKNRENKKEPVSVKLTHRWLNESLD